MNSEEKLGMEAKKIAFHFFEKFQIRYNNNLIAKTLVQAKSLLRNGYTLDDVINTIDYISEIKHDVYSFGYINIVIEQYVYKANAKKLKENYKPPTAINIEVENDNKSKISTYKAPDWLDNDLFRGD